MVSTRALELREATFPTLLVGVEAASELVDDEFGGGIHDTERTLTAGIVIVRGGGGILDGRIGGGEG